MNSIKHNPETRTLLRMFQLVAIAGLTFCVAQIAQGTVEDQGWRIMVYASWFVLAIVSIEAIFNWVRAGVYTLVLATCVVTAVDLLLGYATIGGASLGLLVAFVIVVYLRPVWKRFE